MLDLSPPDLTEGRYSCYHHTLKVTAWSNRYVSNFVAIHKHQPKRLSPTLTAHELRQVKYHLFRRAQLRAFPSEVSQLQTKQSCQPDNITLQDEIKDFVGFRPFSAPFCRTPLNLNVLSGFKVLKQCLLSCMFI